VDSNIAKYRTQQVMTASPAQLVYMLYDRAINSLKEAIAAIEAGNIEARWRANNRAIEIINHLWTTLDLKAGGEIAQNLDRLYPFMTMRLAQVDIRNNPVPAREIIALLEPLRDAWRGLAVGSTGKTNPAAAADATKRTIISA
jgi:flagellar secretion chaperone FliS